MGVKTRSALLFFYSDQTTVPALEIPTSDREIPETASKSIGDVWRIVVGHVEVSGVQEIDGLASLWPNQGRGGRGGHRACVADRASVTPRVFLESREVWRGGRV